MLVGGRFQHALHSPGRQVGGLSHLSLFVLSRNRSIFYSLESTEVRCCNRRGRFQHALPSPGRQLVVEPREDLSGMRNWVQPRPLPWGLAWLSWGQMLNTLTDTSPGWLERQTGGRWLHLQGMWSLVSRSVRSWMELTQLFNFHMKHRMEGRRKGWR